MYEYKEVVVGDDDIGRSAADMPQVTRRLNVEARRGWEPILKSVAEKWRLCEETSATFYITLRREVQEHGDTGDNE